MKVGEAMEIRNLTMSFGTEELFRNVNLHINDNSHIGIVGINGAGKTTLFKIMMEKLEPDEGKIIFDSNKRIEWLPQVITDEVPSLYMTVLEFVSLGRPIKKLLDEQQLLYEKLTLNLNAEEQENIFKKIDKINTKLDYWNYYSAESELLKIVNGLNINQELLNKKLNEISGGEKSKVAFAKLLYSNPEIMLLDEPTNHLDKESKEYITNYLKNYRGGILVISHDIDFLNKITNQTLFLDKRTKNFKLYEGNYERFIKLSSEQEKELINQAKIQNREEQKLKAIINKYATSSGKKKKMAQDREKKLEKLLKNKIELLPNEHKAKINLEMNRDSNTMPLKVENLSFKYNLNSPLVLNNISFSLNKGEKFLVVGENGVGKSTLLKLIMGILTPLTGKIEIGSKTDIGYYAQEHELLDYDKTILENFNNVNMSERKLRSVLGRFLFFGDDVFKKVKVLSPGEKSRVALAKLSLQNANFLILDEPTNHLDPSTQEIIAETFKTFPGTMLIVSHNPSFVDALGIERVLLLPSGKILYYSRETVEYYEKINTLERKNGRLR